MIKYIKFVIIKSKKNLILATGFIFGFIVCNNEFVRHSISSISGIYPRILNESGDRSLGMFYEDFHNIPLAVNVSDKLAGFNLAKLKMNIKWNLDLDLTNNGSSCSFNRSYYYIVIAKINDEQLTSVEFTLTESAGVYIQTESEAVKIPFSLPTTIPPEGITKKFTLEFWECLGECKMNEYDKKTEKKAETNITVHFTP